MQNFDGALTFGGTSQIQSSGASWGSGASQNSPQISCSNNYEPVRIYTNMNEVRGKMTGIILEVEPWSQCVVYGLGSISDAPLVNEMVNEIH